MRAVYTVVALMAVVVGAWALNALLDDTEAVTSSRSAFRGCSFERSHSAVTREELSRILVAQAASAYTPDGPTYGCTDCMLSDTIPQTYCESRGTDCDGLFGGWDESYNWVRSKLIYQCPPNNGFFVKCTPWIRAGCCDDGQEGLPNPACSYPGAGDCATRQIPPPP